MKALYYENLIRGIFESPRTSKNGADADIYRRMDLLFQDLKSNETNRSRDEREIDFNSAFAEVRNNIYRAGLRAIEKIRYRSSKEDISQLRSYVLELDVRFYNRERLDEIIILLGDIYFKYFTVR